ncbi:MFS transporter [Marinobacterium nitratireducens]|uniref:MFS transporter n=1 Tax=Marinobacterium nitratireducens TaxID=518897 RepID=A0A917ZQL9_9GAMM|nr:MFS transporter [Marinobacterium nitratireducens]GGO88837.1 MFS transporter [Marinobacterium nitratireducens]
MTGSIKGPFDGRTWAFFGAAVALLLAAANLRGAVVVVGPLVADIRAAVGLSASQFSLLTTLPLACFGLFAICVPRLASRYRAPVLVIGALMLIAIGAGLRATSLYGLMLAGTLLLGSAIALLNVLIPGLVKGYFPRQAGLMTGLYSVTLSFGAGCGVFLAVPLRDHFGAWQAPLLLWALLPLLCACCWLYMLRTRTQRSSGTARVSLWRDSTAWSLTLFMGLQSLFFYSIATWLPKMLMDAGLTDQHAGLATSMINLAGIPANLLVPILAARMQSQRPLALLILVLGLSGLSGLLLAPSAAPLLWASLMGLTGSASLSLALALFALRTRDIVEATSLSAMAQSLGYLIAATGPVMVGGLNDLQAHWHGALLLLILAQLAQFACGWHASRPGFVIPDQQRTAPAT